MYHFTNEVIIKRLSAFSRVFLFLLLFIIPGVTQSINAQLTVRTYPAPKGAPETSLFKVTAQGKATGVYPYFNDKTKAYSYFDFGGGEVTVEIACAFRVDSARVAPKSAGINPQRNGNKLSFTLSSPRNLSVEFNGRRQNLFLFANPLEVDPPSGPSGSVIYYGPGYHEITKEISVESGQTLYIAGGAFLRPAEGKKVPIGIHGTKNVKVRGRGVAQLTLRSSYSSDLDVEGIIIHPNFRSWMTTLEGCSNVRFDNYKAMGHIVNNDGIDIMSGCYNITVDRCFIRSFDDSFSFKHHPFGLKKKREGTKLITIRNCVLENVTSGSSIRIGAETVGKYISDIRFENCDIIHSGGGPSGGHIIDIKVNDKVLISNITFENIRIEEIQSVFLGIDLTLDWYKVGTARGHVDGVYIRNVKIDCPLKKSYIKTVDKEHMVSNLHFHEVYHGNNRIDDLRELECKITGPTGDILFNSDATAPVDTAPPTVTEVVAIVTCPADSTASIVYVSFSEKMEYPATENTASYSIIGGEITAAKLDWSQQMVILTTSPLKLRKEYTLRVRNAKDVKGNIIKPAGKTFTVRKQWNARLDYATFYGKNGWRYEAYNPKPVQPFNNREDIIKSPRYWKMQYYTAPDGERWNGFEQYISLNAGGGHPDNSYNAVRTWVAPVPGTVRITGKVVHPKAEGNGVGVMIVKSDDADRDIPKDSVLWGRHIVANATKEHDVKTSVQAGEAIRFIIDKNGNRSHDSTAWSPSIEYSQ